MPTRGILGKIDWFSAYIASASSGIDSGVLPIPTLPSSISENISLNTHDQQIVARWAPIVSYSSTNARTISFTFSVADDYMPTKGDGGEQYSIHEYVDTLKSLEYPDYSNSSDIVVPQAILKLGNIKCKGIVTSVSITWGGPVSQATYSGGSTGTFSRADISVQFKEISNTVKGSVQIKSGDY